MTQRKGYTNHRILNRTSCTCTLSNIRQQVTRESCSSNVYIHCWITPFITLLYFYLLIIFLVFIYSLILFKMYKHGVLTRRLVSYFLVCDQSRQNRHNSQWLCYMFVVVSPISMVLLTMLSWFLLIPRHTITVCAVMFVIKKNKQASRDHRCSLVSIPR